MAEKFDPDAFLAKYAGTAPAPVAPQSAPSGGFDPDAFLARHATPSQPATGSILGTGVAPDGAMASGGEEPGLLSSVAEAGLQGASLGFADEIEGGLRALLTDTSYSKARDAARARYAEKKAAHPLGTGLAEILGGVGAGLAAGGIGAVARVAGTGVRGAMAIGGAEGALQAVGTSEAKDAGGVAKDAVVGGALGAGLAGIISKGVGAIMDRAPESANKAVMSELFDKSTPTVRRKAADMGVDVVDVARAKGLDKVATDPVALADATTAAKQVTGRRIGEIYDAADNAGAGVEPARVFSALDGLREGLEGPSAKPMRERLAKYVDDVREEWGDLERIPLKRLNAEIGELEAQGFASANLTPKAAAKLQRRTARVLEDELQSGLKATGNASGDLPTLNREYRALSLVERAAKERARGVPFSTTGLRDIAREQSGNLLPIAAGIGAAGGDIVTGGLGFAGAKIAKAAGGAIGKKVTHVTAALLRDAKSGNVTKQKVADAIRLGVPMATVQAIMSAHRLTDDYLPDLTDVAGP